MDQNSGDVLSTITLFFLRILQFFNDTEGVSKLRWFFSLFVYSYDLIVARFGLYIFTYINEAYKVEQELPFWMSRTRRFNINNIIITNLSCFLFVKQLMDDDLCFRQLTCCCIDLEVEKKNLGYKI